MSTRPHLVICHLKRTKVDVNRGINEAAEGDPTAEQVYEDFHGMIQVARAIIGRGVLFDIHGQVIKCDAATTYVP